jgi:hypothetical protein
MSVVEGEGGKSQTFLPSVPSLLQYGIVPTREPAAAVHDSESIGWHAHGLAWARHPAIPNGQGVPELPKEWIGKKGGASAVAPAAAGSAKCVKGFAWRNYPCENSGFLVAFPCACFKMR